MLQPWILILASLAYISILFAIAHYGDRQIQNNRRIPHRALIYSLSIAIYCTSWTFYGAVGSAATKGWDFFAIYLGPILLIIFGFRFFKKLASICIENNITTIADFVASRYGKAQGLAVLVTVIAILGTLPYIALQLKAVASSYNVLASNSVLNTSSSAATGLFGDTGLVVAILMALFSILFGTRNVNASEHHEGIILAVAFESVVKLVALIFVCLFALYGVFNGPGDLVSKVMNSSEVNNLLLSNVQQSNFFKTTFISHTLLSMAAIFCLPRQFHVAFVEVGKQENMKTVRWVFPLYLALTSLVVVPITLAGIVIFSGQDVNPDMFVLTIPMSANSNTLALLAFIGGFSAATGMVIVAVIALSTMVCNDIVMPILFKIPAFGFNERNDVTRTLILIRRLAIISILFLSYTYYRYISDIEALASIGLIAFVAAVQFAPAIVGGVYWKQGSRRGATIGLLVGFSVWVYTLFLPALGGTVWMPQGMLEQGPWGLSLLKPYALFGVDKFEPITHGFLWSLSLNLFCYIYFSVSRKSSLLERIQAANFTQTASLDHSNPDLPWWSSVEVGELRMLAEKFIGETTTKKAFSDYAKKTTSGLNASEKADTELINFTEHLLAGAIGSSSARLIISSVLRKKKDLPIEDVLSIVDEASQALQFSQELLTSTIDHIDQGISVVDENLNIVAWNRRYIELYNYPKGFIHIGRPIADVIRSNANAGECGPGNVEEHINKRLKFMQSGTNHSFLRYRKDGTVLHIQGKPMPGGGFVTSFTDITEHKENEKKLLEVNENLESLVDGRTLELSEVNAELEQANKSKIKFLAAVNHDVMQPLNAARLFTSALNQSTADNDKIVERITSSLRSAEQIIHTLLDVSKLDSGAVKPNEKIFDIDDVISPLANEFTVIAAEKNIIFKTVRCHLYVKSDPHLLRRVLQNLISNALRYTPFGGRVTIGCRRLLDRPNNQGVASSVCVQVYDTGIGISDDDLQAIFVEFKQLDNGHVEQDKGVGLGLAIAQRISRILQHSLTVKSHLGRGSMFSLTLPICKKPESKPATSAAVETGVVQIDQSIKGLKVLCIDNDRGVLDGMQILLTSWGCVVSCARSYEHAKFDISQHQYRPDIMLVDYHLDHEERGMDAMDRLREKLGSELAGVLITADCEEELKEQACKRGYAYLRKPVNPGRLRKLLKRQAQTFS